MKHKVIYLLLLAFINISAQTIIKSNYSFKPSPYEIINYGKSSINVFYKVNFTENPLGGGKKKEALCVLNLNNETSKFFDYNQLKIDSLDLKYKELNALTFKEANEYLSIKVIWENVLLQHGNISKFQDNFRKTYQYEEITPKINWILVPGSREILGFDCKKAVADYRGRSYTAWYNPSIPIPKGPFVFGQLPGLVLEVSDNEDFYHFTAIAINKKPTDIYLRNEKNIIKTDREKFRTVQRTYYENPNAYYSGKAFNIDGTPIVLNSKPVKYQPLEKD